MLLSRKIFNKVRIRRKEKKRKAREMKNQEKLETMEKEIKQ